MKEIAVFSDDFRDALKGSVFEATEAGFASGSPEGNVESVKFGIVGAVLSHGRKKKNKFP